MYSFFICIKQRGLCLLTVIYHIGIKLPYAFRYPVLIGEYNDLICSS